MPHLVLFGPGYAGSRIAAACAARGWVVRPFGRSAEESEVVAALATATHIVSTAAPEGVDRVLERYGRAIVGSGAWLGYLSSTGVYGDAQGAWVDESAPIAGRRRARNLADGQWLALDARVLRLPGIYGPGRSPLDRVRAGAAHRVDLPGQVFSRIHVDDLVCGVLAATSGPPGAYNLADDLPVSQNAVVEEACALLGLAPPPLIAPDDPRLSPAARAFYGENRRVANGRARRVLGWRPAYPDYRFGLRALSAMTSPTIASPAPAPASVDQR